MRIRGTPKRTEIPGAGMGMTIGRANTSINAPIVRRSMTCAISPSDTVSFGEPIPPDVLAQCFEETEGCDCMLVAGTSATVYPAAQFPLDVRQRGGQLIEVNLYESELTAYCSVSLRGSSATLLPALVARVKRLRPA